AGPDAREVRGDRDLAVGHDMDRPVEVPEGRPPETEVLDGPGDAGDPHDVPAAELVLDEDERAVEVVLHEALRPEADRHADAAQPGDRRPDLEVEDAEDLDAADDDDEGLED